MNFFQAELRPIDKDELNRITKGQPIEERIGPCPKCKATDWWLLPKISSAVRRGGKHYCECFKCGFQTHL